MRTLAKTVAPEAEDTIGYGIPVLKINGKYLIGFSAFKDHLSIFPGPDAIVASQEKLKDFKQSKSTVRFTLENPILDSLLKEIIENCLKHTTPSK